MRTLSLGLAAFLGGCAAFSPDGGFGTVESIARERLDKDLIWARSDADADDIRARVGELLASPLSVDDAVQVALLNNRGLQAGYAELGIAEADLVQAGRLPNPRLSYLRLGRGDELKTETVIGFNILSLLTLPLAAKVEARRFEQTRYEVAGEVLRVASETRRTYFQALAAEESVRYLDQVKVAAGAGADLARRMAQAGNWSKLTQMREQVFYADATAQLARATQARATERERLTRLMGLWGSGIQFKLPERLPDLPAAPRELANIESLALEQRVDIQAERRRTEAVARSLGLTRATRFINALELAWVLEREGPGRKTGYEVSLELPIFDWGGARVAKAEAIYMRAVNRVAETAINARSEVRDAYSAYRTAFDLARHYRDEIVPLRKRISEENVLRYNGMLIGVFELLADAREQVASVNAYIEALRGFWAADVELQAALTGKSTGMSSAATSAPAPAAKAAGGH
ncbi:MAG: TolC family protein [Burkholderiales bacterium]